jgi:XRE family transcriptional regulator, regulator of sulfur utilization
MEGRTRPHPIAATVGARARQLRILAALSIPEEAARAGVLPQQIVRLERGRHVPTLPFLARIADALGVPLAELLKEPKRALSLLLRLRSSPAECARLLPAQERSTTPTEVSR